MRNVTYRRDVRTIAFVTLLAAAAAAAAALSAGCVGRSTMHDYHEGQFKLTFHNDSTVRVCAMHLYLVGETERGANLMTVPLVPGRTFTIWIKPATYQVYASACPDEKKQISGHETNVAVNIDSDVVFYSGDDPKSKEAAQTWAHDHHNVTLVEAKPIKPER
jgi:hypothetical protein